MFATAVLAALVGLAPVSRPQAETRNAIVYGARAVGETAWHYGSFALDAAPKATSATFEIGVFFLRAQGAGFLGADYTTYIDGVTNDFVTDRVSIVEDPDNGTPATGVDGRVGRFAFIKQTQRVFANRGPGITGSGYRIATATGGPTGLGDTQDTTDAGGVSPIQQDPVVSPDFNTGDRELVYRFNLTVSRPTQPGPAPVYTVRTPPERVGNFFIYNALDGMSWTDFGTGTGNTPTVETDSIELRVNWLKKALPKPLP